MDKEYIERKWLIHKISQNPAEKANERCAQLLDAILEAPAADVEPVRHGRWIGMEGDECSECRHNLTEIMDADSYFAIGFNPNDLVACPFCGARMDGGSK